MEKLLELLNEYGNENKSDLYYKFELKDWYLYCYDDVTDILWTMQDEAMVICSKKFLFIKWLLKNNKIDLNKIKEIWIKHNGKMDIDGLYRFPVYERLLMILAIQDEPINFLISILK